MCLQLDLFGEKFHPILYLGSIGFHGVFVFLAVRLFEIVIQLGNFIGGRHVVIAPRYHSSNHSEAAFYSFSSFVRPLVGIFPVCYGIVSIPAATPLALFTSSFDFSFVVSHVTLPDGDLVGGFGGSGFLSLNVGA